MYVPPACAPDGGAFGSYFALGDYDPPAPFPTTGHEPRTWAPRCPKSMRARELLVTATQADPPGELEGIAPVPSSGDVDVLVLPALASCALAAAADAGAPPGSPRTGERSRRSGPGA